MDMRSKLSALGAAAVMGFSQNGAAQPPAPGASAPEASAVTVKSCFNQMGPYINKYDAHKRGTRTLAGEQLFIGDVRGNETFQKNFFKALAETPQPVLDLNVDLTGLNAKGVKHFTGDAKSMSCGEVVRGVLQHGYRPR